MGARWVGPRSFCSCHRLNVQVRWGYCSAMSSIELPLAGGVLKADFGGTLPVIDWAGSPAKRRARCTDPRAKKLQEMVRSWQRGSAISGSMVRSWIPSEPAFFCACWNAAMTIPPGQTRSYAWLARKAGRPRAIRAAAASMARNPLALLVPCHRVVGTNDLGGFCGVSPKRGARRTAGWELELKARLLDLERKCARRRKRA